MNIQISPISMILVTPFYALCLFLLYRLWRKLKASPWRWGLPPLIPVLALLPFADEFWIAWHFEQACKEAGVHVYRQVEVEGFYDSTMRSGYELIRNRGYQFMEHPANQPGKIGHVVQVDGHWRESVLDRPTARYHLKHAYQPTPYRYEEPVSWRILKHERQIVDVQTGEVIARETRFSRALNTIDWLWARFWGGGGYGCIGSTPNPSEHRRPLYEYALLPMNSN